MLRISPYKYARYKSFNLKLFRFILEHKSMWSFSKSVVIFISLILSISLSICHEEVIVAEMCWSDGFCEEVDESLFPQNSLYRSVAGNLSEVNITIKTSFSLAQDVILNGSEYSSLSVSFFGMPSHEIVIRCAENSPIRNGFYFKNVGSVSFHNIAIENCGMSDGFRRSALFFVNCTELTLDALSVRNSLGSGVFMRRISESISVTNSNFMGNHVAEDNSPGGSGVYLVFSSTHHSSVTFQKCHFENNRASFPGANLNERHRLGGGLSIEVKNNSSDNFIEIIDCFFHHNEALWGGGMYLAYNGKPQNNNITVRNASIVNNSCGKSGGGIDIGYNLTYGNRIKDYGDNLIRFHDSRFVNNSAGYYGGGMGIFSTRLARSDPQTNFMTFENCTWENNTALAGSAVDVAPTYMQIHVHGVFPRPRFIDCTFRGNRINNTFKHVENDRRVHQSQSGEGTMLITGFRVQFEGEIDFSLNNGSAVFVSSGTVEVLQNTTVKFVGNEANRGGAFSLGTFAFIIVHDYCRLEFADNTAHLRGGAIFAKSRDPHEYLVSSSCFIHSATRDHVGIKFTFEGNRALSNSGNDIFASSVKPCGCRAHAGKILETFLCIGDVDAPPDFDLTTNARIFFLNHSSQQSLFSNIIPGNNYYDIPITGHDEYNRTTQLIYEVIQNDAPLTPTITHISRNRMQFKGLLSTDGKLQLKAGMTSLSFDITSADYCSPGFHLIPNTTQGRCDCEAENFFGISHCDSNRAYIIHGFWMGWCKDQRTPCTSHCPLGFCTYGISKDDNYTDRKGVHLLPAVAADLDLFICGPTRTGILCGSCRENHSAFYHSYEYSCGKNDLCKYGILFYVISELLPLTVMFFTIIIFDINFTAGNINGFILYAQIMDSIAIDANGAIIFPPGLDVFTSIHRFVYRTLNFDFFSLEELSFCLWENATTLDVMVMKYVTILYAIGLLILLIIFMNTWKCKRLLSCWRPRTIQSSATKGLTAFIVICYSQCARVSFQILSPGYLYGYKYHDVPSVVFRRGDYKFFGADHLKYAIPAFIVIIIMSLIPFFLILYPLIFKVLALCKLNESKLASGISRIIPAPLLDSFQSSYKDNFRFFAGLYFLYRLMTLAAYAYSKTLVTFYTLVELYIIIILALHSAIHPYKEMWHNVIDSLIFANLAIINGITIFNYFKVINAGDNSMEKEKLVTLYSSLQAILIYIPLVVVIVYFFVIIVKKFKCKCFAERPGKRTRSVDLPPLRGEEQSPQHSHKNALLSEFTYGM